MSVNPTNLTSDHTTACQCHPISTLFHPTSRFSVRTEHQILPGLCYCLASCFSSFFQLLRRRSHVRIVLGRPNAKRSVPDTWFTHHAIQMVNTDGPFTLQSLGNLFHKRSWLFAKLAEASHQFYGSTISH
jgi:hypothetical protein